MIKKSIRFRPTLLASVGIAALVLVGCTTEATTPAEEATDAPETTETEETPSVAADSPEFVDFRVMESGYGAGLKLGFIALGDSIPFSSLVTESMRQQAEIAGVELIVCDSDFDGAKALECVQNFKTQGVQGYLNFQLDSAAAAGICAEGPQVPVISVDIRQEPCQVAFMGANNERAGFVGGVALGEYFQDNFNCEYDSFVSLEQPAAGVVNDYRMGGYQAGFASVCGDITNLVDIDAGGVTDQARTVFADVLTTLPGQERIVVVGINDDVLLGALAAARTAGREGDLYMSGQGADPSAHCEIAANPNWVGDVAYFPERYGEIGISYLIDLVNGVEVPADLLIPHVFVDGTNIGDFYDVTSC